LFNILVCRRKQIESLIIALVLNGLLAGFAHARPSVFIKHTYYSISGLTSQDLRAQMDKNGPGTQKNGEGDARTKWAVNCKYGLKQDAGGCRIHNVITSVKVTFIMPRWKNASKASPELRDRWQNYQRALQNHEDGHSDIALKAAQEIESVLTGLRPMRNCSEMDRAANSIASDILSSYKKKEMYYDIYTLHGKTQGATFR